MTLGQALEAKVRLIVWCRRCQYRAEPEVADQVASYGEWARRWRRSACDGRHIDLVVSGAAR